MYTVGNLYPDLIRWIMNNTYKLCQYFINMQQQQQKHDAFYIYVNAHDCT